MMQHRIEAKWIDSFAQVFTLCGVKAGDTAVVLSETQSRPVNVQLAELALLPAVRATAPDTLIARIVTAVRPMRSAR